MNPDINMLRMQAFRLGLLSRSNYFSFLFLQHKNKWFGNLSLTFAHDIAGVIIIVSVHWVGCIFYFSARLHSFDDTTWLAEQEQNIPLYQVSTSDMLSDYIICIYKGLNVLIAMGYDGTISKCRMRRVISPARLPLFLALLIVLCKWGCEDQLLTNFTLTRHFFFNAGDIPNNQSDMLWATCGFFIQNYIAALTLGTMLNYLVRTHILRISCYLSPQLTRDLPTISSPASI